LANGIQGRQPRIHKFDPSAFDGIFGIDFRAGLATLALL
jgi:hypothetical protein